MAKAFGIVTSCSDRKVKGMTDYRPVGAFNFLGRFRVIDFPVSNFSNSGIEDIQAILSSNPRALANHLGDGRAHNLNSKRGGIEILFSAPSQLNTIYNTNVAAFKENIVAIKRKTQEYVVIAPSSYVFIADYEELLAQHIASGADITMLYHATDKADERYNGCTLVDVADGKITGYATNMGDKAEANVFMDSYIMKKDLLVELVEAATEISSRYSLVDVIMAKLEDLDVAAAAHTGYFATIVDLKAYYECNLGLLNPAETAELFKPEWPIYTRMTDSWPTEFYAGADVKNSYVCNSGDISGKIEGSIVGRGVKVAKDAVIKNCIVLSYVEVGEGAYLENQVIDRYAKISAGVKIVGDAADPGYIRYRDTI